MQVDLGLTAHANARVHYDSRKKHVAKAVKTVAANEAAFKAAEKKATQQLQKVRWGEGFVCVGEKQNAGRVLEGSICLVFPLT